MNSISNRKLRTALLASGLALASAAQAQNVIVRTPENAAELRANLDASMRAASVGKKVGMTTGRADPQPERTGRGSTIEIEFDATTLMHSVARINADGKVEMVCVAGSDDAQKALAAPVFAKRLSSVASKEHRDVK